DWEEINLLSGNFGKAEADMYQIALEQQITDDLFLEVAARREDFKSFQLNAQSGSENRVFVDVNETLLDGRPNPHFGETYLEVWEPTAFDRPTTNEAVRASAVYELDFTRNDGWTRWLGRHNIMGLAEAREIHSRWFRWREAVVTD